VDPGIGLLDLVEVGLVAQLEGEVVEERETVPDQVRGERQVVTVRGTALHRERQHLALGLSTLAGSMAPKRSRCAGSDSGSSVNRRGICPLERHCEP
jgi:hypothetical protein